MLSLAGKELKEMQMREGEKLVKSMVSSTLPLGAVSVSRFFKVCEPRAEPLVLSNANTTIGAFPAPQAISGANNIVKFFGSRNSEHTKTIQPHSTNTSFFNGNSHTKKDLASGLFWPPLPSPQLRSEIADIVSNNSNSKMVQLVSPQFPSDAKSRRKEKSKPTPQLKEDHVDRADQANAKIPLLSTPESPPPCVELDTNPKMYKNPKARPLENFGVWKTSDSSSSVFFGAHKAQRKKGASKQSKKRYSFGNFCEGFELSDDFAFASKPNRKNFTSTSAQHPSYGASATSSETWNKRKTASSISNGTFTKKKTASPISTETVTKAVTPKSTGTLTKAATLISTETLNDDLKNARVAANIFDKIAAALEGAAKSATQLTQYVSTMNELDMEFRKVHGQQVKIPALDPNRPTLKPYHDDLWEKMMKHAPDWPVTHIKTWMDYDHIIPPCPGEQ